jgi:deoxyribose-phosphate aldolase
VTTHGSATWTREALARTVDHTLLKPEATSPQVQALAAEAAELGAFGICVSPSQLPVTVAEGLVVCIVVGFPSGAHESEIKAAEAALAVTRGATEVDMVIDLGSALAGDWGAVEADVAAVRAACGPALLKVIVESAALTPEQLAEACRRSEAGGARYVKTSTGFHPTGGASIAAVRLMRETVGDRLGVKASGGIRDTTTALAMLEAGASRLGVSGTRAVLAGLPLS